MNKVIKWICIVCAALFVLGLGTIGVGTILGGKVFGYAFNLGSNELYTNADYVEDTVQINPFSELYVESSAANVIVKLGNENKVTYRVPKELLPEIKDENGKLTVISQKKTTFDFNVGFVGNNYIEIEVNEDGLKNIDLRVSSGDVLFEDLDLEGVIKVSSGDINITGCEAGKDIELKTSSGAIDLVDSHFENITHKQSSGDTSFERVEAKKVIMEQSSGSSEVYSLKAESLEAHVTSGSYKVNNSDIKDVKINATSGDISGNYLKCEELDLHATSGDVDIEIEGKEDDYNYEVKATSGSVRIGGTKSEKKYEKDNGSDHTISVGATSGDVSIGFVDAD